jgi:hypothetical protein
MVVHHDTVALRTADEAIARHHTEGEAATADVVTVDLLMAEEAAAQAIRAGDVPIARLEVRPAAVHAEVLVVARAAAQVMEDTANIS